MAHVPSLKFGVEIETIVHLPREKDPDLYETVSEALAASGLEAADPTQYHDTSLQNRYEQWDTVPDTSVQPTEDGDDYYGIEIVSPIFAASDQDEWSAEIEQVWCVLEKNFSPSTNETCGTHVHLSPLGRDWSLEEVKNVAVAALYFDLWLEALVPEHRRRNGHCRSNRTSDIPRHLGVTAGIRSLREDVEEFEDIQKVMNSPGADLEDRDYRWNFMNLTNTKPLGARGTIEFRLPPGSASADATIKWIELALSFVTASISPPPGFDESVDSNLETFKCFLMHGAQLAGIAYHQRLESLF